MTITDVSTAVPCAPAGAPGVVGADAATDQAAPIAVFGELLALVMGPQAQTQIQSPTPSPASDPAAVTPQPVASSPAAGDVAVPLLAMPEIAHAIDPRPIAKASLPVDMPVDPAPDGSTDVAPMTAPPVARVAEPAHAQPEPPAPPAALPPLVQPPLIRDAATTPTAAMTATTVEAVDEVEVAKASEPAKSAEPTDAPTPAPPPSLAAHVIGAPKPAAHLATPPTVAPTAPSVPEMPDTASVAHQLNAELAPLRDLGDGRYELHVDLHPAELGRVGLDVHVTGSTVHVTLQAEHAVSHALLDSALPELRAALEHAGLASADLHLAHHRGNAARDDADARPGSGSAREPSAIDEAPVRPNRSTAPDAVDLLL